MGAAARSKNENIQNCIARVTLQENRYERRLRLQNEGEDQNKKQEVTGKNKGIYGASRRRQ